MMCFFKSVEMAEGMTLRDSGHTICPKQTKHKNVFSHIYANGCTAILREQAQDFKEFRDKEKVLKPLKKVLTVLHRLSSLAVFGPRRRSKLRSHHHRRTRT
jgi:hypothetical protein